MITRACLALALTLSAAPAFAVDDYIGFYRGINIETGSLDAVSITPNGPNFVIELHATSFGACEGSDKAATAVAVGTAGRNTLRRTDGVATCTASGTNIDLRDGEYVLSNDNELLTLHVPDHADVHYHRVSDN